MRYISTVVCSLALVAFVSLPDTAAAQQPAGVGAQVSRTFTIEAIDYTTRLVTLKDSAGQTETIYCGPEVERFNALKTGDTVTFRYVEAIVYGIRKPGAAPAGTTGAAVTLAPGDRPGGTIAQQMTTNVTVSAIDAKAPSVTITTKDGKKMSFKVADPKNLEGVTVGDQVEITYTQALAVSVAPAPK